MELFIATNNRAKLFDYQNWLKNYFKRILSPQDYHFRKKPNEIGTTFRENAFIKARFYINKVDLPILADDGGIEIDALHGEPGVKSRRWLGDNASDEELINYTLEKLKNVPFPKRICRLKTVLCFWDKKRGLKIFLDAHIKGHIAVKASPLKTAGYPFRAIFIVDRLNKLYQDLNSKEHEQYNHRKKAILKLINKLKQLNYFK